MTSLIKGQAYSAHRLAFLLLFSAALLRPFLSGVTYPFSQGILLVFLLVAFGILLLAPDPLPSIDGLSGIVIASAWLLVLWSFATLIWTPDPGQGIREVTALLLNVLVFSLAFLLVSSERGLQIRWLVLAGFLGGLVSFQAVYQRFFGFEKLLDLFGRMEGTGEDISQLKGVIASRRVFAGFLNPNMLAGFLSILIPFCLDAALTSVKEGRRRILWVLTCVLTCALALTGSLGGILVAGLVSLGVVITRKGAKGRPLFALAGIAFALVVALLVTRGPGFIIGPESSFLQRAGYMKAGIRMGAVHPLLGWGSGAAPGALMAFVARGIRPVTDPHNFLIRSWIAWGIPGILLITTFLLSWAVAVPGKFRHNGWRNLPAGFNGLFFGGCAFILHSLMDMDFFVPETAFFGLLVMGMALGASRKVTVPGEDGPLPGKATGEKRNVRLSGGRLLPGILALAAVLPSLLFFQGEIMAFRADRMFREGSFKGAGELYNSARKFLPYNGRFALNEGRAVLAAGHPVEAMELFKKADRLMKASPYPSWEIGKIELQTDGVGSGFEASVRRLDLALKRYPTSPRIRIDLALAYLGMGERGKAVRLLEESRQFSCFDPEAKSLAGELLAGLGR